MMYLAKKRASQIRFLVLITGLSTTFAVWTSLADPIGIPKMFVLAILSTWLVGSVISGILSAPNRKFSPGQWAILGFVLATLVAAILTDVKYTAFFGAIQRNDGAISYLALASLSFAAMSSFRIANIVQVRTSMLVIGGVLTFYGLLQTSGHDPFKWVLLYNPIIGTLGNPDFYSGLVGAVAIASLWLIRVEEKKSAKVAGALLLIAELFVLKRCGSIQGIAELAVGFVILMIVTVWQIRKRFGIIVLIIFGVIFTPIVLGLLNIGPLARHLYRGSFQSRMDYWHAALSMFKSHPFAGVGLDRFGEYYGQYAPQIQIVQGQPTDNAHNVFLQLLATGGIIVILPYIILMAVILTTAIQGIKNSVGKDQLNIVALFSVWFALLLVSFISIDNLGVVVWFWIIGGALYGVTRHLPEEDTISKRVRGRNASTSQSDFDILSPIISFVLSILILMLMVPAWKSSSALLNVQRHTTGWTETQFVDNIDQAANVQRGNVQVHAQLADIALRVSAIDLGFKLLDSIRHQDARSLNGNYLSAFAYEISKKYELALPYRLRLLQIDPWSTRNMLQIVTDYVALKDMAKARDMSSRLSRLYPNSSDAKSAEVLVKE